jgi:hypothetical protein
MLLRCTSGRDAGSCPIRRLQTRSRTFPIRCRNPFIRIPALLAFQIRGSLWGFPRRHPAKRPVLPNRWESRHQGRRSFPSGPWGINPASRPCLVRPAETKEP